MAYRDQSSEEATLKRMKKELKENNIEEHQLVNWPAVNVSRENSQQKGYGLLRNAGVGNGKQSSAILNILYN